MFALIVFEGINNTARLLVAANMSFITIGIWLDTPKLTVGLYA